MAQWFCHLGGQQYGPIDESVLRQWILESRIKATDNVWSESMPCLHLLKPSDDAIQAFVRAIDDPLLAFLDDTGDPATEKGHVFGDSAGPV